MRHTRSYSFTVSAPISVVWEWHERPEMLAELSPPEAALQILHVEEPYGLGSTLTFRVRAGLAHVKWVARIVRYEPPHLFEDEMVKGPFRSWRHTHVFEATGEESTRLTDEISYEMPFGVIGELGAPLVAHQIDRLFAYRRQVLERKARAWREP